MSASKKSVIVKNGRLSYCHVFEKGTFQGKPSDKYECTLLIDKADTETVEKIRKAMIAALMEKYKTRDNIPKQFAQWVNKDAFGSSERIAFRDGDAVDEAAYEGMWSLKGANKSIPTLMRLDKSIATEEDGLIYSGAYADAKFEFWIQDSKDYGKRINANISGIRFRAHGDALAAGGSKASADDFDDLDDDDLEDTSDDDFGDI